METSAFLEDLALRLRSRHPLILIETAEKARADELLRGVAERCRLPYLAWTRTKGLRPPEMRGVDEGTLDPRAALARIEREHRPLLAVFQGLGPDLRDPVLATALRDACAAYRALDGAVVVTGEPPEELPGALRDDAEILALPTPGPAELEALLRRLVRESSRHGPIDVALTRADLDRLVGVLRGATLAEAERALALAIQEDRRLGPEDVESVARAARAARARAGRLVPHPPAARLDDLAGLERLKGWLARRERIVREPEAAREFGLDFPRGVLLAGVQGAGKSLAARAVAGSWGLPLLELAPAELFGKYVGETEANLRRALDAAERAAPAVLWIDEIEKALAGGGDADGGASRRMMGRLLSWLQERAAPVFVVATANDVEALPPELVRKGRFDEIFFLDLPTPAARAEMVPLLLRRRGRPEGLPDLDPAALERIAAASEGFSGAEMDAAIAAALARAFAEGREPSAKDLEAEIRATRPLSVVMAERVAALRAWARGRTVPADGPAPTGVRAGGGA